MSDADEQYARIVEDAVTHLTDGDPTKLAAMRIRSSNLQRSIVDPFVRSLSAAERSARTVVSWKDTTLARHGGSLTDVAKSIRCLSVSSTGTLCFTTEAKTKAKAAAAAARNDVETQPAIAAAPEKKQLIEAAAGNKQLKQPHQKETTQPLSGAPPKETLIAANVTDAVTAVISEAPRKPKADEVPKPAVIGSAASELMPSGKAVAPVSSPVRTVTIVAPTLTLPPKTPGRGVPGSPLNVSSVEETRRYREQLYRVQKDRDRLAREREDLLKHTHTKEAQHEEQLKSKRVAQAEAEKELSDVCSLLKKKLRITIPGEEGERTDAGAPPISEDITMEALMKQLRDLVLHVPDQKPPTPPPQTLPAAKQPQQPQPQSPPPQQQPLQSQQAPQQLHQKSPPPQQTLQQLHQKTPPSQQTLQQLHQKSPPSQQQQRSLPPQQQLPQPQQRSPPTQQYLQQQPPQVRPSSRPVPIGEKEIIVVMDTNCILGNLPMVCALRTLPRVFVKIPMVVIRELDHLKTTERLGTEAREATRQIFNFTTETPTNFAVQGFHEMTRLSGEAAPSNNDERILQAALFYREKYTEVDVFLITDDVNLRVKAVANSVATTGIVDFIARCSVSYPVPSFALGTVHRPPANNQVPQQQPLQQQKPPIIQRIKQLRATALPPPPPPRGTAPGPVIPRPIAVPQPFRFHPPQGSSALSLRE